MLQRGLQPQFPKRALLELEAIARHPAPSADPAARDLRRLTWVSIDNDDSRDLDQLSVAQPVSGEVVKILVAVADVDTLVKARSAIDEHAHVNTTSVYTAAQVFPMLPEQLSTDLTSLGQDADRPAVVVDMAIRAGTVIESEVYRAVVRNHAKLAYNGVAAWLDGAPSYSPLLDVPEVAEQVRIQDRVAQEMRALRHQHGALTLETTEARPVFDGEDLTDLRVEERNRAKDLIEDYMIAANGVIARFLRSHGSPALRRVLRSPERWPRIIELAANLGQRLPQAPDAVALEAFLRKRREADPPRFADLSLAVVKLLGRGEYVIEQPDEQTEGHFGLAVHDYTHSTAPNRRFADLVTQRLLKAAIGDGRMPYSIEELAELAHHCTEQADNAAKVERQVRKSAAALLLARRVGESFDAIVTGASESGTWVRIFRPAAEGKVVGGSEGLDVGDHVRVKLVDTDVERGFIDFRRA
ncbi:MAG TPA: RNB domain-containing ribonuclease [Burkholderiales bacterium]|nr:RNB domain-containing ribonuclease [Burkholderiales bacterium]